MAAGSFFEDLNDIPLPDFGELQIPSDLDFSGFDESGLPYAPTPLIVNNEASARQPEPSAFDYHNWLPPATPESHLSEGVLSTADHHQQQHQQHTESKPTERAAAPRGTVERKAEQNRCAWC